MFIPMKNTLAAALHQANLVIRLDATGHGEEANKVHARLHETLERSQYPNLVLLALARKLGRDRARLIAIEPEVIDRATKGEAVFVA